MSEDLDVNYARAGYHHKLEPGRRPALLMIDFCEAYFEPSSPLYAGVDAALASALRLRTAARAARVPVILTQVVGDAGRLRRRHFSAARRPSPPASSAAILWARSPGG